MLEKLKGKEFEYKKLTEAEQKARGILGRLIGPCADFTTPTRNGRSYSEKLWENVFSNPLMQEKIENKCCFGELGHPENRSEIDMEKVAISLAEKPKKGADGKLYGVFDILSTPNGKILKALCDYGCKIGISSRGQGDVDDFDNSVDPDTYECECFDAVIVPGVQAARLKYVTEDFNNKPKLSLKTVLSESLNNANESDRKIMIETLNNLNLNEAVEESDDLVFDDTNDAEVADEASAETEVTEEPEELEEPEANTEDGEEVTSDSEEEPEAEEEKSDEEIFLEFLATNFEEDKVRKVCALLDIEIEGEEETPEEKVEDSEEKPEEESAEELVPNEDENPEENINVEHEEANETEEPVKEAVDDGAVTLVKSLKEALKNKSDLENSVKSLQEKLAVSDAKVDGIKEECNKYKNAVARLSLLAKSSKDLKQAVSKLEESVKQKTAIIQTQKERITRLAESNKTNVEKTKLTEEVKMKTNELTKLTEALAKKQDEYNSTITALNNQINESKIQAESKIKGLTETVDKVTNLKESYRKLANKTVNKYIEIKSETLGLTPTDIRRKLGESYTIEDVDQVCEDLKQYQLNVSKLPFSLDRKVGVRVNESKSANALNVNKTVKTLDDDVDDSLIKLANFTNY